MTANLKTLAFSLDTQRLTQLEETLEIANLAWTMGNKKQAQTIFKKAKANASGNLKKIYAGLQKSDRLDAVFNTNFKELQKRHPKIAL